MMLRNLANSPDGAEAPLEVRLFGELEIARKGYVSAAFETRKARAIFARLVLNRGKAFFRDELAECFWPESEPGQSRAALRTELWRIRLVLARLGLNPRHNLESGIDTIRFSPAAHVLVDVEMFRAALAPPADCAILQGLYRADLLKGEYGDWCAFEREQYRTLFVNALETAMMRAMARHDFMMALDLGSRLMSLDPLAEHIHRKMIECHSARGNRPAALRQYARCALLLQRELNVAPMAETRALVDDITTEPVPQTESLAAYRADAARRLACSALREAARQIDDTILARSRSRD